jgi:uncharacterized protein (TIGR01777 family)
VSRGIIALSGAQGFVGSHLALALRARDYEVWPLVRKKNTAQHEIYYDYKNQEIDKDALAQCTAVVHLAGKNIMSGLWTKYFKKELWESRISSTRLIAQSLVELMPRGPKVFVCASAVGFYGDRKNEKLDEKSTRGMGFLAELCEAWEEETKRASKAGIRVVNTRFGMILDKDHGSFLGLERIFSLGLGAIIGSQEQFMALVDIKDVVRAIIFALENPKIAGPINVVCPKSITNADFSQFLAHALKSKIRFHIPAWIIKALGEQGELMLASCRAKPQALLDAGFSFSMPYLKS